MQVIPKFTIDEDWGTNGDVTVTFEDSLPYDLQEDIAHKLQAKVQTMDKRERCTHKLYRIIEGHFHSLVNDKKLRWSPITKHWMWDR